MKGPYADPVMEEGCGEASGRRSDRAPTGPSGAPSGATRGRRRDFGIGPPCGETAARSLPRRVWAGVRGCPHSRRSRDRGFVISLGSKGRPLMARLSTTGRPPGCGKAWAPARSGRRNGATDGSAGTDGRSAPRCSVPSVRLLESRTEGLRALACRPRRPLRADGADVFLPRPGACGSRFSEQASAPSHNRVLRAMRSAFPPAPPTHGLRDSRKIPSPSAVPAGTVSPIVESLAINGRPLEPSENPAVKKRTSAPKKAFDATEGRRRPSDSILA